MGLLKISSPPAKQHSVRKELLESIGLEYDSDSFQSPTQKKAVYSPESSKRISFLPLSSRAGEHARTTVGALKTEPESSRRRRDSLDRVIAYYHSGVSVLHYYYACYHIVACHNFASRHRRLWLTLLSETISHP